ncbi:hypothetical protein SPI_09270 [Niveomyces insectorum RCEF 264]|uniref:Guanine nucleotide-exchange factor SEC12 n=1 Tax=Niveomyces insectorum RCEF 264 TaxID=1081102 RepID=A0A162I8U3_9HYPO|nr:hypothetical protein SPI_09270 [Niveomyces insectorum RCEF 264]
MDIQTSRTTLDYPLYVCEFDPSDPGRLIVGGGGGASRTGVGNKITLLNAARSDDPGLPTTAELELPRDEDSVTSLAVGPRRGRATLAFAGINSRVDAQGATTNDHFRVFAVDGATASAKSEPKITELARAPFFSTSLSSSSSSSTTTTTTQPDLDTYQRVVRVSPPFSDGHGSTLPQLGACATGLAKADGHEIVVFDVTSAAPAAAAVKKTANTAAAAAAVLPKVRGRLELPREAVDLDLVQTGTHSYQLAFAHEHALYLFDVDTAGKQAGRPARSSFSTADGDAAAAAAAGPRCVYTIPLDKDNGATERLTFRALRYVTPGFVLAACNLPRRTGVVLLGLRLPSAGVGAVADQALADGNDNNNIHERRPLANEATIAVNVRLPTAVAQATGLAVRNLAPPAAPGARHADDTQFVVAVAGSGSTRSSNKEGSGISLSLYTLVYRREPAGGLELLTKLYPFRTLRSVHELPMTSLALSAPSAVASSSSTTTSTSTSTSAPYVRLASVSVKNTVVVHHIPLRKVPPAGASGRAGKAGKAPPSGITTAAPAPHYVVALRSRPPTATALLVASALLLLVLTLLGQALLEMRGLARPWIGVRHVVPAAWQAPKAYFYKASSSLVVKSVRDHQTKHWWEIYIFNVEKILEEA